MTYNRLAAAGYAEEIDDKKAVFERALQSSLLFIYYLYILYIKVFSGGEVVRRLKINRTNDGIGQLNSNSH